LETQQKKSDEGVLLKLKLIMHNWIIIWKVDKTSNTIAVKPHNPTIIVLLLIIN
jgi:hypothetical protein